MMDEIIRVDRFAALEYPKWVKEVLQENIARFGQAEYPISAVRLWFCLGQERQPVSGLKILNCMESSLVALGGGEDENYALLKHCLGLADLQAIAAKGLDFYRKYFCGLSLYGWKTLVLDELGNERIPFLVEEDGKVILCWGYFRGSFGSKDPAAMWADYRFTY